MSKSLSNVLKAIFGAVTASVTAYLGISHAGTVSAAGWIFVVASGVGSFLVVYVVPNLSASTEQRIADLEQMLTQALPANDRAIALAVEAGLAAHGIGAVPTASVLVHTPGVIADAAPDDAWLADLEAYGQRLAAAVGPA